MHRWPVEVRIPKANHGARHLFRAWPDIIARLKNNESRALLLDFDGTLVRLRRRPEEARLSERGKRILKRLVTSKRLFVAVVSGRKRKTLETMVGVEGIRYIGLHGAERGAEPVILSKTAGRDLVRAQQGIRSGVQALPGIWIEEKKLSFAVHYRGAHRASLTEADRVIRQIVAPMRNTLRVLNGNKVWEVMPQEIPGKGAAVRQLLEDLPASTIAMYFGDDQTDEEAFANLPGQITVKVGGNRNTRARYYLRSPSEVVRCLLRLERELT